MYIRPVHAELDIRVLHQFVRQYPLGLLITHVPHPDPLIGALQATHIPWVIDAPPGGLESLEPLKAGEAAAPGVRGIIRGHMARANPHTKALLYHLATSRRDADAPPSSGAGLLSSLWGSKPPPPAADAAAPPIETGTLSDEALIIFQAPTHSYVTPKFYTATKPSTGKVVPTWDYAAVQIYGRLSVYNKGTESEAFLQRQVEDLTDQREAVYADLKARGGGERGKQWEVADSPVSYVELLKKGIVGLEVEITRIEGRFKLSQESPQGDWEGVVDGFRALGTEDGEKMAEMIEGRGKERPARETKNALPTHEGADNELSEGSAKLAGLCPVAHT